MKYSKLFNLSPTIYGLCVSPKVISEKRYSYIKERIRTFKRDKWKNLPKDNIDLHEGIRFHDDERITNVILGSMNGLVEYWLLTTDEDPKTSHKEIFKYYVENIDDKILDIWIRESLLYSSSSDYYYIYEKEWE